MPTIRTFDTSGDAYDACQCDERIKNGDVLFVPSEGVVGLAHTWPVAATAAYGELHTVQSGQTALWALDCGIAPANLVAAIELARANGLELHASFNEYAIATL